MKKLIIAVILISNLVTYSQKNCDTILIPHNLTEIAIKISPSIDTILKLNTQECNRMAKGQKIFYSLELDSLGNITVTDVFFSQQDFHDDVKNSFYLNLFKFEIINFDDFFFRYNQKGVFPIVLPIVKNR